MDTLPASGLTPARAYRFSSSWALGPPTTVGATVGATVGDVYDVLEDVAAYPAWWRSVIAVGRVAEDVALVACRSRMPTTLHLVLRPVVRDRERGVLEAAIEGDLVGWSRFTLTPTGAGGGAGGRGAGVHLDYEQEVDTTGRLLTLAGRIARPVLEWNHEQMMRALRADLDRRVRALS